MNNEFLEKWKTDNRFKAKVKLSLYGIFVLFVTILAISHNNQIPYNETEDNTDIETTKKDIINIPEEYNYIITINIDDKLIEYTGSKLKDKTTIIKKENDLETNYILQNNEYYIEDNGIYVKTTREEVYDTISYNYINLETINSYLQKGYLSNNQYSIYIRDVSLGIDSDDYFVISIKDNDISIDYTPLIKLTNENIEKYKVKISIEEIKGEEENEKRDN